LSVYDIHNTTGANKELGLHSQTRQCIGNEYVKARKQFKKSKLNWRKTKGVRRSLGGRMSSSRKSPGLICNAAPVRFDEQ